MDSQKMTIPEALRAAIEAHKSGNLQDAERIYRAILQAQPNNPDANHNLGVLAVQVGKHEVSLQYFKFALETNPKCDQFWLSYVDALVKNKNIDKAKAVLDRAKSFGLANSIIKKLEAIIPDNKSILHLQQDQETKFKNNKVSNHSNTSIPKDRAKAINYIVKQFSFGNYTEAEKMSRDFIQQHPNDGFGYKALGSILAQCKMSEEAVVILKKGLKFLDNDADIYNSLAKALKDLKKLDEAILHYKKSLEIKPDYANAYNNLGNTLQESGRLDEAILNYRKSLEIKPDYVEAYYNLGNALQESGRLDEAILNYEKSLEIEPDYAEAYNNLGTALQESGRLDEAILNYEKSLEIKPDFAKVYNNMGTALQESGRLDQAIFYYRKSLEIQPDYAEAHNNMGNAFQELGRLDEALVNYKKSFEIKPGYAEAYNNMGNALQELGRFDEALVSYKKSLTIKPDYAEVYYNALDIKQFCCENTVLSILNDLVASDKYRPIEKMHAHFSLGKLHDRNKNYHDAFINLKIGHKFRSDINKLQGHPYRHNLQLDRLDIFKKIFTQHFFVNYKDCGLPDDTPIFIVGFPRSGTSLVEQILASHSSVYGAGELKDISQLESSFIDFKNITNYQQFSALVDKHKISDFSNKYLERIKFISNNSRYATDKMPHNFEHIWFINLLFKNATILHCVRSPEDTCLSCYFNKFTKGHEYIDDLQDLAKHYKYYLRMMSLWKSVLPNKIFDISYENLVSDPEPEIRKLLSICNLDFEEQCFKFYKTARPIRTASATQVRKKMYTSSVGKWKKYEQFLKPLLDELHKD